MDSEPQRQSSLILGLRAFIMLAGLVAVPLAAIFGSSLPDLFKEFGTKPSEDMGDPVAWNTTLGATQVEAPRFEPFALPPAANTAPASQMTPTPQHGDRNPPVTIAASQSLSTPNPFAIQNQQPVGMPFTGHPQAVEAPRSAAPPAVEAPTRASYEAPAAIPPGPERFTWMERRLRDLGATYYLLEAWGGDGGLFRFHCKMAIAGNAQLNRHFEATDPDPLRAMERVLLQVEAWRAGRQP